MFKRFVSLLICATFLLGGTTTAFADEVAIDNTSGYSSSALVASTLTVSNKITDLPLIGEGGLVVDIPSDMPLEYDRGAFKYSCETTVGVRGELSEFAMVYVTVPNEVTYTNTEDEAVTMTGEVEFQFASNTEGYVVATWTSEEAAEGKDDSTLTNTKDLNILVDGLGAVSGDYDAEVTFEITVDKFGVFDTVGEKTVGCCTTSSTSVSWNKTKLSQFTSVNIGAYMGNYTVKFMGGADENDTIKYIALLPEANYEYNSQHSLVATRNFYTWLSNLNALEVIYIPNKEVLDTLRFTKVDDITTVFTGTGGLLGNAINFIKGFTDDEKFIYVPHIAFGGTMDEWIESGANVNSGASDWVFGNAANDVTVHCTDGTLLY